jgi:ferrochelatase
VRRYLAEFLSDPRVVELPRWLWLPLLHGVILNLRPRRSAHAYAKIWRDEGSPLLCLSRRLEAALAGELEARHPDEIRVALGMRYGEPALGAALRALVDAGARRVLVLPLYPQYAAATTASASDAVFACAGGLRWIPELRFVSDYHDDPRYIDALARSVRAFRARHGAGQHLLLSFHGLPRRAFLAGDPYHCQCQASARLLATALGHEAGDWSVSFQSRVGRAPWLTPYTDVTLEALARRGVATVDVLCPGFAVDCLETLEEIAIANAARFTRAGGRELRYIPALNDDPAHVAALAGIVLDHVGGWLGRTRRAPAERAASAARARALGAPR